MRDFCNNCTVLPGVRSGVARTLPARQQERAKLGSSTAVVIATLAMLENVIQSTGYNIGGRGKGSFEVVKENGAAGNRTLPTLRCPFGISGSRPAFWDVPSAPRPQYLFLPLDIGNH